ncbi:50S ribosomal protein L9 [Prolixibacter denitrificans]|uniref:Large ribosomal subunit protein bL9 n=1 Tax=Prolixibacter denitrificans TaxID=1541063 RepID=A0A2P8CAK3_9BACT|nr:50S ribosomal protein L9 [Prolixibacter denitrificans]PSK81986.1 large subunit ribosomal protein L9 [Prolixibacter denitrificans]GET22583.1 50S ribosomal protein L9 [Prolixibacter denitrificans]
MEIILLQDVPRLGSKDDIVNVKDGYARNFLIPQRHAVVATESAKKVLSENQRQRAHKEAKLKEEAQAVAAKLEGLKISIGAKTSTTGKIFGSVNNIQIAEALKENGFDIDRKQITIKEDAIKEVGKHIAKIKLHREVYFELEFEVVSE